MHKPVLMHADVHEHAEVNDVAHRAHQLHPRLEVLYLQHVLAQQHGRQLVARVASGLHQLADYILKRRLAHAALSRGLRRAHGLHARGQLRDVPRRDIRERI